MASDDLTILNLCVRVRGGSDDEDDGGDTDDEDDENEVEGETWDETWENWAKDLITDPNQWDDSAHYLDNDLSQDYCHMLGDDHNPPWDPDGELMDADDIRDTVKIWWNERFYDQYYDEADLRASEDDGGDEPAEDDEADLRASECDGGDEPAGDDEADLRASEYDGGDEPAEDDEADPRVSTIYDYEEDEAELHASEPQPEGDDEQGYHLFLHISDDPDPGPINWEAEEKHRRLLARDIWEAPDYNKLYPQDMSSSRLQRIKLDIDNGIKGLRAENRAGLLPWWGPCMNTGEALQALGKRRDWLERRIDIKKKEEELDGLESLSWHAPDDAHEWEPRIKVLELEIEIKKKELQLHELRSLEVHEEDYDVHDDY